MQIGTIALQKYFNGVASPEESDRYKELLKEKFKDVGMFAFGQMKFICNLSPKAEDYDWKNVDAFVGFCIKNNISAQYNTVINNSASFPDWYKSLSAEEKEMFIESHVRNTVKRYKGSIDIYKLVNECIRFEDTNYLGTNKTKKELINLIFNWARDEYPKGTYMINDHIAFSNHNNTRKMYIDFIKELTELGCFPDIIGIEGHMGLDPYPYILPEADLINKGIEEFLVATNIPLYITEFDLSYDNSNAGGNSINPNEKFVHNKSYSNWYEYQGIAYKQFLEICLKYKNILGINFWGLYDKDYHTWERPGIGLFDENFNPKPAYNYLKHYLVI